MRHSFNYRNRYGDALNDLGLMDELEVLLARIGPEWEVNNATISRWLHLMRQACFHAQAGAPAQGDRRVAGNRLGGKDDDKVQFVADGNRRTPSHRLNRLLIVGRYRTCFST